MNTLFFDLDGTLINSEPAIFRCVRHAFAQIDRLPLLPNDQILRSWIGPPLRDNFRSVLGADEMLIERAVTAYRQRFDDVGWQEFSIYDGLVDVFARFAEQDTPLYVVTSKVEHHAQRIIASLPFGTQFRAVIGAAPNGTSSDKKELVDCALALSKSLPENTWMIGDRHFDIHGAHANKVRSAGVLWGVGSQEELLASGSERIVRYPGQLTDLLVNS
jgi:phosphoglycolate phosphatase